MSCLACDTIAGRVAVPGGAILETERWVVDHCVGPLGVGTLIVKPRRHVAHVWELEEDEADELGPLLQRVAGVIAQLAHPDQVYVCLWSHDAEGAAHIHFVMQPVPRGPLRGPSLQAQMFDAGTLPPANEAREFAEQARRLLRG